MAYVVQDFTSLPNVESYNFHSVSAFTIFLFLWESMGKPFPIEAEILDNLPSLEGNEIRRRAAELGVAVRRSVVEGGVTRKELDSFIAHITR
ncbi:hypothetical protein KY290_006237 [Solanum tuberosum]|nr:hypothetical protein KY284_006341 [Solanum tuberosum]KAH0779810.1 hypothetical protein KY290_006237 [Solanum tuberosum]